MREKRKCFFLHKSNTEFQKSIQNRENKNKRQNFKFFYVFLNPFWTESVALGSCSLLRTNREELSNDFKGHALGFWNFQENKHP